MAVARRGQMPSSGRGMAICAWPRRRSRGEGRSGMSSRPSSEAWWSSSQPPSPHG